MCQFPDMEFQDQRAKYIYNFINVVKLFYMAIFIFSFCFVPSDK